MASVNMHNVLKLRGNARVAASLKASASEAHLEQKNIFLPSRRTSLRLHASMWQALDDIALREGCSIHDICSAIDAEKLPEASLSTAIRVFVLEYYRAT